MHTISCILLCMVTPTIGRSAESEDSRRFTGSWELVSYELRLASGTVLKPFGEHPVGRILYQENGQMSAQLMRAEAAPFASADMLLARADEADRAWRDYIGYWGTFTVDPKARVVVHDIQGSWFPNWRGQKQIRSFRFSGDQLTLEADSPAWHAALIWRRID